MKKPEKLAFDSNLMREPGVIMSLGSSVAVSGICRDILIWAASQKSKDWVVLNVPEFCRTYGYNRQHLLKRLAGTEAAQGPQVKRMQKARFCIDEETGKTQGKTLIDYALFTLLRENVLFSDGYSIIDKDGCYKKCSDTQAINLLNAVRIKRSQRGTQYAIKVHENFIDNCTGGHYTSFSIADYLNIRTPSGVAWEGGRRLFLRLTWKAARIAYQDKKPAKDRPKDYRQEDYKILKEAAGLNLSSEKKNAAALRAMIKTVEQLGNLGNVAELTFVGEYGQQPYQVRLKKASRAEEVPEAAE